MKHSGRPISEGKEKSINAARTNVSKLIGGIITLTLTGIQREVALRTYSASNELRNAALYVLRGERTGRLYRVPFTKKTYTASAPGESPAVRTGVFRLSWGPHVCVKTDGRKLRATAAIESNIKVGRYLLGELLENGTGKMAPRPYKQKVIDMALQKIKAIYKRPYKGK